MKNTSLLEKINSGNYLLLLLVVFTGFQSMAQSNEALLAYNKGLDQYKMENYDFALPYFNEAVSLAPNFEAAYQLMAICYDEKNDVQNAIQSYEKALRISPNQEKTWYNLALLYISDKREKNAIDALEKAIEVNPDYGKAHNKLGILYSSMDESDKAKKHLETASKKGVQSNSEYSLAIAFYKQGKFDEALENAEIAVDRSPTANGYYLLGLCQQKNMDLITEAISSYEKAIELNDKYLDAYLNLGVLCYNENYFEKAAKNFGVASKLKPESSEIFYYLGRSHLSLKSGEQAVEALREAVALDYKNGETHYFLARAYQVLGELDMVSTHYQKSKSLGYSRAEQGQKAMRVKFYNQGITAYKGGQYEEAIESFQKAIKEDPKNARFHFNLGLAYGKSKQTVNATESLERAISLDSKYGKAHLALGNLNYNAGKLDVAAENYESAIRNGINDSEMLYILGNTYFYIENYDKAITMYKKASEKKPNDSDYIYNLGMAYIKSGKFNTAITKFEETINIDPKYVQAYYNIGLCYKDLEQYQKGLEVGEKLLKVDPDYAKGYLLMAVIYNKMQDSYNEGKYLRIAKKMDPSLKI